MSNVDSIFKIIICILNIVFWCVLISKSSEKEVHYKNILIGVFIVIGCIVYRLIGTTSYFLTDYEGIELLCISIISVYLAKIDINGRKRIVQIIIFPLLIFSFMSSNLNLIGVIPATIVSSLVIYIFIILAYFVGKFSLRCHIQYSVYEESILIGVLNWIIYYVIKVMMNHMNYNSYSISIAMVTIVCAVTLALYVNIYEYYMRKMQNQMIHLSYKHNETNIENIKKMSEDTSRIRHDLKNCIIAIKGYSDSKDYEGLSNYIDEYSEQQIKTSGIDIFCDNQVVNFIINNKFMLCKQQGIQTKCIVIGQINEISEVDLSILLGNLLDNAIEATQECEYPAVSVEIYCDGNESTIIVDNTIKESVLKNNKELKTSKRDKANHGFGVMSIKSIALKNDGEVYFSEIKNVFRCKVVMKSRLHNSIISEPMSFS